MYASANIIKGMKYYITCKRYTIKGENYGSVTYRRTYRI